jgi:hypothetical protein
VKVNTLERRRQLRRRRELLAVAGRVGEYIFMGACAFVFWLTLVIIFQLETFL